MHATEQTSLRQRLRAVQAELIQGLEAALGASMTPKLERLVQALDWLRLEEFVLDGCGVGRPPRERFAIANAFVAKVVLGLPTTVALIDRLKVDRMLRRICGFACFKRLPDEATFSRAFAQFAKDRLAERVHEALVKEQLGAQLIGHLSRDGTAIEVRESPAKTAPQERAQVRQPKQAKRRGRPLRDEVREPKPQGRIERQRQQDVAQMLAELPRECDRGAKSNAQGYKNSWNGYKLHLRYSRLRRAHQRGADQCIRA